jgi:hypothetical protein
LENVGRKRSKLLEQTEIGKPRLDVKVTTVRCREPISQPGYEPAVDPAETPEGPLLFDGFREAPPQALPLSTAVDKDQRSSTTCVSPAFGPVRIVELYVPGTALSTARSQEWALDMGGRYSVPQLLT